MKRKRESRTAPDVAAFSSDPQAAIEAIDYYLDVAAEVEVGYPSSWEKGADFLEDVREKLRSVKNTITEREEVSAKQAKAIDSWGHGICRWHPELRGD